MARNWYSTKALSADTHEVSIFEEIGIWGVTARQYLADFNAIQAPNVTLYLNSPGGNVVEAVAMLNGMLMSGKHITVKVMGIAASAASYLMLAGNVREMPENTYQFLHDPLGPLMGDADEHRELADQLDKMGDSLVATYMKRTGKSREEIKALLAQDALLTAQECLDFGLCDVVTPVVAVSAKFDPDYPGLPPAVTAMFKAKPAPAAPTAPVLLVDQITAAVNAAGLGDYVAVFTLDDAITTPEAATLAVAQAREVLGLCASAKLPDMAAKFIKARTPTSEVRASLVTALADADEAAHVDTSQRSDPQGAQRGPSTGGAVAYWAPKPAA